MHRKGEKMSIPSAKPVWWKVILGAVLVLNEINSRVNPAPNMLKADNAAQQFGMNVTEVVIALIGCWLIYSGTKPLWNKTP